MIKIFDFRKTKQSIGEVAIDYIKKNKKALLEKFASDKICLPTIEPVSIFMAGVPGAGKTEVAKSTIKELENKPIHIDADAIKEWIPGYCGSNSVEFQGASALGVEKLYDYALKKKKDLILDATFADYEKSLDNIKRSLNKNRIVKIYYVYQDPQLSWEFTKIREEKEGRFVPKFTFNKALLKSGPNVLKIKEKFPKEVEVYLIEKNLDGSVEKTRKNISSKELESFLTKKLEKSFKLS